jgi:hypothetical protein
MVIACPVFGREGFCQRTTSLRNFFWNDPSWDAARHHERRNVMRGHGIGRQQGAASNDDPLDDRRVGRDPRSPANTNRRQIAWAKPVAPIDWGVISGDQDGVWPELHFVLQDHSSPGVQPTTCRYVHIAADFQAIGKIDGHVPSALEIFPAAFERRPQQEPAQP